MNVNVVANKLPNHFDTDHLQADLMGHTIRGGKVTLCAQVLKLFLNIGSVMILARLLTPSDFGIIAMVTALTGVIAMFKDAGLSMATVQRDIVNHEQISTLFWINVALSLALALLIAALAPVVAWFYDLENLKNITLAVASIFFIGGLTVQHQALIRRQMRFGTLAKIQIISAVSGLAVAILGALNGAGYWSLIMQMGVSEITSLFLTWAYCRWIPGKLQRAVGTRSMVKFGGYLTGFNFVNYFARNADNILIGKFWGGSDLGLYSKAYSLLLFPIQQINGPIAAVTIPALSRLQNDPEQFAVFFKRILVTVSSITFPLIAIIIICSKEIIFLVLGDDWIAAVPIFTALAISGFFQPIGNITGILYVSLGRTQRMFKWGLMSSSWIILSFIVGLPYGVFGVALSYSIAITLMMTPLILYATHGTPLTYKDFYYSIRLPAFATLVASFVGLYIHSILAPFGFYWLTLASTGISTLTFYLLLLYLISKDQFNQSYKVIVSILRK